MSHTPFSDTTAGKVFNAVVGRDKKAAAHGDPTREVFETVVFVVVLVLLLKLFVAEAFVIPTGSMASTLWGDQVRVTCPDCGTEFPVSAAVHGGTRQTPGNVCCQNCGLEFSASNSRDWNSGDRVLVAKYAYHIRDPHRFDVPVFRFPEQPYSPAEMSAMNYIKRLVGLPGETIAIYKGDLYRTTALTYPDRQPFGRPEDRWRLRWPQPPKDDPAWTEPGHREAEDQSGPTLYIPSRDNTYTNDPSAVALFLADQFEPIRKSPDEILAVRRLVFDLDRQPKSLTGVARTRWHPAPEAPAGWADLAAGFQHTGGETGWLRYHHVATGWRRENRDQETVRVSQPAEITDYLAYNSPSRGSYWVPDLIVECKAEFANATDKLTLELTKAGDRFQAVFDAGVCRLYRVSSGSPDRQALLAEQPTGIGAGTYKLRLANVDSRLTVWVDGKVLPFGPAADYPPPDKERFDKTTADVNEPARIGATGGVTITHLQLWRDIYYTADRADRGPVETHYVQPGHYFCMGDNSASSSDGRTWGLVPERLVLGRAVVVYWPLGRIGVIK